MGRTRWEAGTLGVFLRKIAYDYLRYGYVHYALREIPEGKDLAAIDDKIRAAYGVTYSWSARAREKAKGRRCVVYIRYGRTFVLLATEGTHEAFDRIVSFDLRTAPLHIRGYTIGMKGGVPWVSVSKERMLQIRREITRRALAPERDVRSLLQEAFRLRFPGVVRQEQKLITHINVKRRKAGKSRIRVEFGYRIPEKAA